MQLLRRIKAHLAYWVETYVWVPWLWLLMVLALHLVHGLTGRPVIDDPGAIVGWCYNAIAAAMVMMLTGMCQHHLFGYRSTTQPSRLRDDIYDACVTVFLLCFFGWLLWH
jgi:hypothetical protein